MVTRRCYIVVNITIGQGLYSFSMMHESYNVAKTEAERLANKNRGNQFAVFEFKGSSLIPIENQTGWKSAER